MNRLTRVAVALVTLGCGAQGVSLGSEELCVLDPRLAKAQERPGSPPLSNCAAVGANQLVNDGFETPAVASVPDCQSNFCQVPALEVTGWRTTSETQIVELWTDGYYDVPSGSGRQYCELDAETADTLYQDVVLTPSTWVFWSVLHRGRLGAESVEVLLGPPESPTSQALVTSSNDDWYAYSGVYRVGDSETVTRFALSSRTGIAEGNLVDEAVLAPIELVE